MYIVYQPRCYQELSSETKLKKNWPKKPGSVHLYNFLNVVLFTLSDKLSLCAECVVGKTQMWIKLITICIVCFTLPAQICCGWFACNHDDVKINAEILHECLHWAIILQHLLSCWRGQWWWMAGNVQNPVCYIVTDN